MEGSIIQNKAGLEELKNIIGSLKTKEDSSKTNENPYLKEIKYYSLDGKEFDNVEEAIEHNNELCNDISFLKIGKNKGK